MFSVLSSIYYKEHPSHFNTCMESIWDRQTLKPTEIILIEDGPLTPELDHVIALWKIKLGHILRVKKLEKNIGTGKAKNIGLRECTYDIVCIVDTDDICTPERFERQINFLKQNQDISVVGGQIVEFIEKKNTPSGIRKVPLSNLELKIYAKKQSPFNNMTIAYRKAHIIHVGGYQHHLLMEDYNLWLRVLAAGYNGANLPESLVHVRIGNAMIGRRRGWRYIKSEWQLFQLKRTLNFQSFLPAFSVFLLRALPRLLPEKVLEWLYKQLRK